MKHLIQFRGATNIGNYPIGSTFLLPAIILILSVLFCEIAPAQPQLEILSTFDTADGPTPTNLYAPSRSLFEAGNGCFYGATGGGGTNNLGTIFKTTLTGEIDTILFFNGTNGAGNYVSFVRGPDGNLYGITSGGGNDFEPGGFGEGTFFRLTTNEVFSTLYYFNDTNTEGVMPGSLVLGNDGNFWGTTDYSGSSTPGVEPPFLSGFGSIFRITPGGAITNLHNFSGLDGSSPGSLVAGGDGNFYGVTMWGGNDFNGTPMTGCGTFFRITPDGTFTNLYFFDGTNGSNPEGIIKANDGNFYGITFGGGNGFTGESDSGDGVAFSLTTTGALKVLHSFDDIFSKPSSQLTEGLDGNFYGSVSTQPALFSGSGEIFALNKNGDFTNLYSLNLDDSAVAMISGRDGNIYGTMSSPVGTTYENGGTIFRLAFSPGLTSINNTNHQANLSWTPFTNETYRIDFKTNLSDSTWTALATNTSAGGYTATYGDPLTTNASKFYRVVMLP